MTTLVNYFIKGTDGLIRTSIFVKATSFCLSGFIAGILGTYGALVFHQFIAIVMYVVFQHNNITGVVLMLNENSLDSRLDSSFGSGFKTLIVSLVFSFCCCVIAIPLFANKKPQPEFVPLAKRQSSAAVIVSIDEDDQIPIEITQ